MCFQSVQRLMLGVLMIQIGLAVTPIDAQGQGFRNGPPARIFQPKPKPVESTNFVVYADDKLLAQKVSREAERFRKELSVAWLGNELPNWRQKCPIKVELKMHAGGETSFAFLPDQTGRSQPMDWQMSIFGPVDRLLDSVLPHEITHTIFATHFGRPLPRWADEGACTTVEHETEKSKNHQMLMEFLSANPSRGIPFNRMFTMRNYPHDILPLYAQGYSLAKFLIQQKGRRHFLNYVSAGLANEKSSHVHRAWDKATSDFYNYDDLSDLQIQWLAWVKSGSPDLQQIAANGTSESDKRGITSAELVSISRAPSSGTAATLTSNKTNTSSSTNWVELAENSQPTTLSSGNSGDASGNGKVRSMIESPINTQQTFTSQDAGGSWYKREMNKGIRLAAENSVSQTTRKITAGPKIEARLPPVYQDAGSTTKWR